MCSSPGCAILRPSADSRSKAATQLARKVEGSAPLLLRVYYGKQDPMLKVLQTIADVHGIKMSKLFSLAEKKYSRRP